MKLRVKGLVFVEVIFIINTLLLKILSINFLMPEVVCEAVLQMNKNKMLRNSKLCVYIEWMIYRY